MTSIPEITVDDLRKMQKNKTEFFLLDVREPHEFKEKNMHGHLIPLAELPGRLNEIPRDQTIIVHCKSGLRSAQAVQFLLSEHYTDVKNLKGGILAWLDT